MYKILQGLCSLPAVILNVWLDSKLDKCVADVRMSTESCPVTNSTGWSRINNKKSFEVWRVMRTSAAAIARPGPARRHEHPNRWAPARPPCVPSRTRGTAACVWAGRPRWCWLCSPAAASRSTRARRVLPRAELQPPRHAIRMASSPDHIRTSNLCLRSCPSGARCSCASRTPGWRHQRLCSQPTWGRCGLRCRASPAWWGGRGRRRRSARSCSGRRSGEARRRSSRNSWSRRCVRGECARWTSDLRQTTPD